MGKPFSEMAPAERQAATERARDRMQAELQAAAPEIGRIMDQAGDLELTDLDDTGRSGRLAVDVLYGRLRDAIDLASDQQQRTWVSYAGKRVARIVTVDDGEALDAAGATLTAPEECLTPEEEAVVLRTAAEILGRRFGVITTVSERKGLAAAAQLIETGNAPQHKN